MGLSGVQVSNKQGPKGSDDNFFICVEKTWLPGYI